MRSRSVAIVLILALMALLAIGTPAIAAPMTFSTTLSGAEEFPGPGDPNGKGFVTLTIFENGRVCYTGKVQAIGREITGAHIHVGNAGADGGVVVDLDPFNADITGNKASHCVTTSVATATAILANPSGYYVNVHTTDYPGGAIRGQLGD